MEPYIHQVYFTMYFCRLLSTLPIVMSLYSKYVKPDYCFEEDYVLFILPAKKKKKRERKNKKEREEE